MKNQAELSIRAVKRSEWSKFKKSMVRNLDNSLQLSQNNFFFRFMMFLWFRIKPENYVCIKNGEIAGILSLGVNRGDQVFIYGLAVEPAFRGQGIARMLMEFSEDRAKELKKTFLALVVLYNNNPAISLYHNYEYNKVGEGKAYFSILVDKIQSDDTSTIELRQFDFKNNDLKSILDQFILGEIELLSGKEGLEYFEQMSYHQYYPSMIKDIQKGKRSIYLIYNEKELVGILIFRDHNQQRDVEVYSQENTWNTKFLMNLSNVLAQHNQSMEIGRLRFRLSICKMDQVDNLDLTEFEWDYSKNKVLMYKKLT